MLAVDSRSARKRRTTYCIYSIFTPDEIFASGVANMAQRKSLRFEGVFDRSGTVIVTPHCDEAYVTPSRGVLVI
jgi:hypothetical protein